MKELFEIIYPISYLGIATILLIRAIQYKQDNEIGTFLISLFAAVSMYICTIHMIIQMYKDKF